MKIALTKILCPTDFSESAEHAIQYGLAFAQTYQAHLILLHVVELPVVTAMDFPVAAGTMEDLQSNSEQRLQTMAAELQDQHNDLEPLLVTGFAFPKIIEVARDKEVDLIVMGTHGRAGLHHLLLGSVAEKVVRKAPCPVLTVKHPEHEFVLP